MKAMASSSDKLQINT